MATHSFQLLHTPGSPTVLLRELNGFDELMIDDPGTRGALRLLHHTMMPPASGEPAIAPGKIVIADRDYLLSGIYRYTYGSRIESVLKCRDCGLPFDMDFSLDDLVATVRNSAGEHRRDNRGFFYASNERQFRLPDGDDELAVLGMPAEQAERHILERCLTGGHAGTDGTDIQALMRSAAPLLFSEMETVCPECGERQQVTFDMQTFLLSRMKNERKRVAAEVHCLATAYRWSHQEILEIPRGLRKTYAGMIGLE